MKKDHWEYQIKHTIPPPANGNISLERLINARRVAAQMILKYGDQYEPIFDRLDREITEMENDKNKRDRLLRFAAGS
ncbi:hypothetical protein [Thalassospira marina]|uniref:Uncharacterized protein n=1 Tax=Thalassospira marina TaxID=2048283 RepID=A0A2N3KUN9_9PROT|nr:hypothetical protein [Thalassospira marina]PKR54262.1 hypothetical protein COO20_08930 [Thalassospira marina]